MPTGNTAWIDEDLNLSTAKWVTQNLARNFGVCAVLRDHDWDLTEDEIEEYLKGWANRDTNYHKEELIKALEALEKLGDPSEEAWNELYLVAVDEIEERNTRNTKKANVIKLRHQQVKEDLIKLRDATTDEITGGLAKFGLKQLKLVESDTEPYISVVPSFEKFKIDKLSSLNWNVNYHTKRLEEARERGQERLSAYQRIRAEVREILGGV